MSLVSQRHVILVDSSESCNVMAERLQMQDYVVTVTGDPAEASMLALGEPPAAVVANLWMPGISGLQLCRLLRAEPATRHVPIILRGSETDQRGRFWAERAGATAYVGRGRMGELVRTLAKAIDATPVSSDFFMQLSGGEKTIRDRIAAHLDTALFESLVAAEVRGLSACGSFVRMFDLLSQFIARAASYRWLAVSTDGPPRSGLHAHPDTRAAAEREAREILAIDKGANLVLVEDEDAHADPKGPPPIVEPIRLGQQIVGRIALAPRDAIEEKDAELLAIVAREIGGPIRIVTLVEESQRLATTDLLTGVRTRRAFLNGLNAELARSRRYGVPLGLMLLDADSFKAINDRRGHVTGDAVLSAIGAALTAQTRTEDLVGRWGGEEFVVALYGADESGTLAAAERIRAFVANLKIPDAAGQLVPVTVSIGVAVFQPGEAVNDLIDRADRAMYSAKTSGRNRVMSSLGRPEAEPEIQPDEEDDDVEVGAAHRDAH
jgi:two-component system, cell cycle response regulator